MLGEQIKKLRIQKGLTQQQLAEVLHISTSSVGMWEQGRREPDATMLIQIADFYGVTVDYLLGREKLSDTQKALIAETIQQLESLNELKEKLKSMISLE